MVDPALAGQSNRNAVGPGNRPIDGGVPGVRSGKAATAAEAAAALKAGKLLTAPKALPMEAGCNGCEAQARPVTIGALARDQQKGEIGRASCRERVCQYVYISVVAVSLKTKKRIIPIRHITPRLLTYL